MSFIFLTIFVLKQLPVRSVVDNEIMKWGGGYA